MGAILNGLALSQDPRLRLGLPDLQRLRAGRRSASAAIMEIPVIYIFTHDSIGVGEDGPTHQPIEHLASLRAIPGLITLRPGDANEVVEAWKRHHAAQARAGGADPLAPGDADARPHEVRRGRRRGQGRLRAGRRAGRQAGRAPDRHRQRGLAVRRGVRGAEPRRASRRAWSACRRGSCSSTRARSTATACCRRRSRRASRSSRPRPSAGTATSASSGAAIGMKTFGASAPLKELQKKFGFTVDAVVAAARKQLASRR